MRKIFSHEYNDIISIENLLLAWKEFKQGKTKKIDVQEFEIRLMDNIFSLHNDLKNKTYIHGTYEHFVICDPKRRDIHKATVRDRLLHHALYRKLYPFFDKTFITDSYSCRDNKGTHRAMNRFRTFAYKVSRNHTRSVWVLKCDIKKFFASINHGILLDILRKKIEDEDILKLLENIIESFDSGVNGIGLIASGDSDATPDQAKLGVGLPLGNLTSQLLVNIYMNEFDQFVKHNMKVKYYIRYADDFAFLSTSMQEIEEMCQKCKAFLTRELKLTLHPDKVFIKTFASGVDFLGFIHFPTHRILRTVTKRRVVRRVSEKNMTSYFGLLSHGNCFKLKEQIIELINY